MMAEKTKGKSVEDVILGLECCGSVKDAMYLCNECPYWECLKCAPLLKRDAAWLLRAAYLQGGGDGDQL